MQDENETAFTEDEYGIRLEKIRREMIVAQLDLFIITKTENILYLTGYQSTNEHYQILLIPKDTSNEITYITKKSEKKNKIISQSYLTNDQIIFYSNIDNLFEILNTLNLDEKQLIGHEDHFFQLQKNLDKFNLKYNPLFIEKCKLIKSSQEIKKLKESSEITINGIEFMIHSIHEGISENEILLEGYNYLSQNNYLNDCENKLIRVNSGINSNFSSSFRRKSRKINKNDLIVIDFVGMKDNYFTTMTKTVFFGEKLPDWIEFINNSLLHTIQLCMKSMKPGISINDIDKIAKNEIENFSKIINEKWKILIQSNSHSIKFDVHNNELNVQLQLENILLHENMIIYFNPYLEIFDENQNPIGGIGLSEIVMVTNYGGKSIFTNDFTNEIIFIDNHCFNNNSLQLLHNIAAKELNVKFDFTSDNTARVHPKIIQALSAVNLDSQGAYSTDKFSENAKEIIKEYFGENCDSMIISLGTAANIVGISCYLKSPLCSIICHRFSHIYSDEGGAPEWFTRAKLIPIFSSNGKINSDQIEKILNEHPPIPHRVHPSVVSISQPTESGTIYSISEIKSISDICKKHNLALHMDGSRLCNAADILNCSLFDTSLGAGVDVLSLGLTKNGAMDAEVIVTSKKMPELINYVKVGMHLRSKARYLAAQVICMLGGEKSSSLYLSCAKNANSMARYLVSLIENISGVTIEYPVECNTIFLRLPNWCIDKILQRYYVVRWVPGDPTTVIRLMCSWDTNQMDVDKFVEYLNFSLIE